LHWGLVQKRDTKSTHDEEITNEEKLYDSELNIDTGFEEIAGEHKP
jgi:hypothetical protein